MRRGAELAIALAAVVSGVGCGSSLAMSDQTVHVAPARVAALPVSVLEFEVGASEAITPLWDWTRLAQQNLEAAIGRRVALVGGRFVTATEASGYDAYADFRRWSEITLREIIGELTRRLPAAHHAVSEWRYEPGLASWRDPLNADFVLIAFFLDGHTTFGRYAVNAVALAPTDTVYGVNREIACLVDLRDGRLVRCEYNPGAMFKLIEPPTARFAVEQLLRNLLPADAGRPIMVTTTTPAPAPTAPATPVATRAPATPVRSIPPLGRDELLTHARDTAGR